MKKHLTFIAVAALTLTACISDPGPVDPPTTEGSETEEGSQYSESDALLDQDLFSRATTNRTMETCDEIVKQELAEECRAIIDSLEKIEAAVTKVSKALCADITLERYEEDCENQVQLLLDEQAEKRVEEKAREEVTEIEEALNLEACSSIEAEHLRDQCLVNVSTGLATRDKDSQHCETIKDYPQYETCLQTSQDYGDSIEVEEVL